MKRRSYRQYCGLAKALDHVGDRWTLLMVRELMVEPQRYSDLKAALPGIATNLLADRLRNLTDDGILELGRDGRYRLTPLGRGLEPAVQALIRWGSHWMTSRSPGDYFRPSWLVVALGALLPRRRREAVEVRTEGGVLTLDRVGVRLGPSDDPAAVLEGDPQSVLGVAAGLLPVSAVKVRGSRAAARRALGLPEHRA